MDKLRQEFEKEFLFDHTDEHADALNYQMERVWQWVTENFVPKQNYKESKQQRIENFSRKVRDIVEQDNPMGTAFLSRQAITDFINYWTESNENGKKLRFEMQKVFDIKRRLNTWKRNQRKYNSYQERQNSKETEKIFNELGF